jgi:hypothetical protein
MMHNIERNPVHAGRYIGYCDGAWRIWRNKQGGVWHALRLAGKGFKSAATLKELDAYFEANNGKGLHDAN